MKQISFRWGYKIFLAIFFTCMQVVLLAQEGDKTVTTKTESTTTSTQWYTSPWVWVAGGAVFIIILVALMRGNSSTSETRTTVIKDTI